MAAPRALTKPLGAVIATSPASMPLTLIEASGLPLRIHMKSSAPNVPVQPASIVSTAIEPMRRLPFVEAPRVLPGLNPNHPNARMKQPISTAEMSCPMIALLEPSRLNFPIRGPTIKQTASAVIPPTACTTPSPRSRSNPSPSPGWCRAAPATRHPTPSSRTTDR